MEGGARVYRKHIEIPGFFLRASFQICELINYGFRALNIHGSIESNKLMARSREGTDPIRLLLFGKTL